MVTSKCSLELEGVIPETVLRGRGGPQGSNKEEEKLWGETWAPWMCQVSPRKCGVRRLDSGAHYLGSDACHAAY